MLRKFALIATAAGALGLAALATTPAAALPLSPGIAPTIESDIVDVRHRPRHFRNSSGWVRGYNRPYAPYRQPYYERRPYYGDDYGYRPYRRQGPGFPFFFGW